MFSSIVNGRECIESDLQRTQGRPPSFVEIHGWEYFADPRGAAVFAKNETARQLREIVRSVGGAGIYVS